MNGSDETMRIGVIGVGSMGQHHVRIIAQNPTVVLSGLYDPDTSRAKEICSRHGCLSYALLENLLDDSDAVCIAAPTSLHLDIGLQCLERGKHVLMEKPLADGVPGALRLVEAARTSGTVLMVGHIERYNPAISEMMKILQQTGEKIISIDARRLAPFDGTRCMDVDVLYDLMIHDIDLVLEIAASPVKKMHVLGKPVFSKKIDTAHAIMEFQNQIIASFWIAKCSPRKVRSITVNTRRYCLEADTLTRSLVMHVADEMPAVSDGLCFMGNIRTEIIPVPDEEPLRRELGDFFQAIRGGNPPVVDGQRGLAALQAMELVSRSLRESGA
jgi:predicted dehydrogenase